MTYKMNTIFMNSGNSTTSHPHRQLTDKKDLRKGEKSTD